MAEKATASKTQVSIVGSLNMDLVMRLARVPEPGETLTGERFMAIPGGKGANQAVACSRLGSKTSLIGQIGDDGFGHTLREALRKDHINLSHLSSNSDQPTGVAMIMVDEQGENRIALLPGANGTLSESHIQRAGVLIDQAALLVTQLEVPLATVFSAIQRAAQAGVPVLLNPAPAQALPDHWWPLIDFIVPNESEASLLTGTKVNDVASATAAASQLYKKGARHVVITLGNQGVVAVDNRGARHYPAVRVKAIDTTAAGDTFIGGFATGLTGGMGFDRSVEFGIAAAAICVTRLGAQSAIPYRNEVEGFD